MDDSYVLIWHGAAGAGKTMSADVQCIIDMVVYNQKVYSMVPISFTFQDDEESVPVEYASIPLDIPALLRQDEMYRNSVVLWDEINLWLFSRNHQAVLSKVISQLITLRRKLDISFYATSQFLSLVDKNFRIQLDAEVFCFDLHYVYHNLSKGQIIHQELKDISGKFTGKPFDYAPLTYENLLRGDPFKGTYPTKHTFNIFEAMRKYKVNMDVEEVTTLDSVGKSNWQPIDKVKVLIDNLEGNQWYTSDIQKYLAENGITGDTRSIGRMMKKAGYKRKPATGGQYVYIPESEGVTS
jgi:hypothetical protein